MATEPPPPGQELCPHCQRPFKRLRRHLPHCKAAPRSVPGSGSGSGPGLGLGRGSTASSAPGLGRGSGSASRPQTGAAGKSGKQPSSSVGGQGIPGPAPREAAAKGKKAAARQGGGSGLGAQWRPGERLTEEKVEPALRDVAKSLDLPPEEVKDVPERLSNRVKIVIEKHRAKVVREKSGSRSRGASAGTHSAGRSPVEGLGAAQPDPQEGITPPETANTEAHTRGGTGNASASSKGEKGNSLKATKTHVLEDPPESGCRSSPPDPLQQEGTDKTLTEEKQMYLGVGVEYKAPLSALHTKNVHLSVMEGFKGHDEKTSKNDLTSIQKLHEGRQQMAEPILNARRDTGLALDQFLLSTSKIQPICPSQAPGRSSTPAGARGLEWFPDLHPNYRGLSIFPGKPFQGGVEIVRKAPEGNFSDSQQGPLSDRRLLEVRLGELPAWLATRDFSPQGLLGGVQKAWSSYYNKYINVRRGGPAGISMLLAGYCLLSYGWNYQHIKCYRWRKYH